MGKAIWAVLAVLIIIVLGAFFVSRNNQESIPNTPIATTTPTTTSTQSAEPETTIENMVVYSDRGFSPASLTIKVGDTVTFKNESSKIMWAASAPHPTHNAYPEFDAKKGAAKGESYMFTFTKAGTWKYHNHLNSSDTGTIVVM